PRSRSSRSRWRRGARSAGSRSTTCRTSSTSTTASTSRWRGSPASAATARSRRWTGSARRHRSPWAGASAATVPKASCCPRCAEWRSLPSSRSAAPPAARTVRNATTRAAGSEAVMSEDARSWQGHDELSRAAPAPGRDKEFPGGKTLWEWIGEPSPAAAGAASVAEGEGETRRDVLKMMGFSLGALATAGALGCRIPERRALPLVSEPEDLVPGVADFYATTCGGCAAGCGLLVKVRDGRPIKIEGNPDSPLSLGGTCARGQATVLSLYDEQRFKGPTWLGQATSWTEIDAAVSSRLAAVAARGHGIVLLTAPGLGPSFRRLIAAWQERFPGARHRVHEAISLSALAQANERSFGLAVVPRYRLDLARLVV